MSRSIQQDLLCRCFGRGLPWGRLHHTPFVLMVLGLCFMLAARAQATVVPQINLEQMIEAAELIVEGRVVEVKSAWSENQSTIYTYVTLNQLRVIHGQVESDTLTLQLEGGEVDGVQVRVDGMPVFIPGDHDVLFLRDNHVAVSPIVGFFQGRLQVVAGEIRDHVGWPILRIQDGAFVKLREVAESQSRQSEAQRVEGGVTLGAPRNEVYVYPTGDERKQGPASPLQGNVSAEPAPATALPSTESETGTSLPSSGTSGTESGKPSRIALRPPSLANRTVLLPSKKPGVIFLKASEDTGERLSVEAFIRAIRARLTP